jgi:hypothetical protein
VYLESYYLSADTSLTQPTNNTGRRLSTIEMTMIAGVTISAISLALNVWNTMRKRSAG